MSGLGKDRFQIESKEGAAQGKQQGGEQNRA
jgi:hypothetical protein